MISATLAKQAARLLDEFAVPGRLTKGSNRGKRHQQKENMINVRTRRGCDVSHAL